MLLIFLVLLVQAASAKRICTLQPQNVIFSSINLKNVLMWSAPNISGKVRYSVQYRIYGEESWKDKLDCTKIKTTSCDLSDETSNSQEDYYAKVIMHQNGCSSSTETDRFNPLAQTIIGPPEVSLSLGDKSFLINVSYPDFRLDHFSIIEYHISIKNMKTQVSRELDFSDPNTTYYVINQELIHPDPGTTYCVTVFTVFTALPRKQSVPSTERCILIPQDRSSEEAVKITSTIVLPVVLIIMIAVATGFSIYRYIHVNQLAQPKILTLSKSRKNNTIHLETHVAINIVTIDSCKLKMLEQCLSNNPDLQTMGEGHLCDKAGHVNDNIEAIEQTVEDDDDVGYITLQEEKSASKTTITPYDMPHNLAHQQPVTQPTESCGSENSEDLLYGHIKSTCSSSLEQEPHRIPPVKEGNSSEVAENLYKLQQPIVKNSPNFFNDSCVTELGISKECQLGLRTMECRKESDDKRLTECSGLFIHWPPSSIPQYIPNLFTKDGEEDSEMSESLLSKLYKPVIPNEVTEEDELLNLEERWQLHVQMTS
ncbi:interleukin-20 receptor subunit alpha [Spea bombifrons]|uniref:interleukin-20 receptor subunit alpha n=1 Tax=Spea bombifrons TaxID=233779 RepID=UPI002349C83F|nr:interleukin-20 receptor subunit alpha [Spea bombifrons]